MNNAFNMERLGKVIKKDARNMWPRFGSTMLIWTLLPLAVWLLVVVLSRHGMETMPPEVRWTFITLIVEVVAILAPSRMYRNCNLNKEGIYYAMLPASHGEKYVSMLLFTIVVCPLLALCGGVVLDYLLWALPWGPYRQPLFAMNPLSLAEWLNMADDAELTEMAVGSHGMIYRVGPWMVWLTTIVGHLSTVGLFLFTNTIFKSHKVLMTLLCCWVLGFVLSLGLIPLTMHWAANGALERWALSMANGDPVVMVYRAYWIAFAVQAVVTVVLYVWTYMRLKQMKY